MTLHLPDLAIPVALFIPSPLGLLKRLVIKGATTMSETTVTPDLEAFAGALVSAVVSTHDESARKTAVIAAVDAYKDKIASDFGASSLEIMALNWALTDTGEAEAYTAVLDLAEHLAHQVVDGFFGKLLPTLEAALHLS